MQNTVGQQPMRATRHAKIATHCSYRAFQCGMLISGSHDQAAIAGNDSFPVNKGALCIKGWKAAAAASITAFGMDRGLSFPIEDIPHAEVILLVGSNIAETMPPLMQYFEAQRNNGGKLIVVDPRASTTTRNLHLPLTPGSDAALANGLLHILIREGLVDQDYICSRTEGFEQVRGWVATYWPEQVERIIGVPEAKLVQAAHVLGSARSAMILTARGAEQRSQGVNNMLAYITIALALRLVGRPHSGYGCLTGQGNGQGGREHDQKADNEPRQIFEELRRASAKGVADYSGITYEKIEANQDVFWSCPSEDHPGTKRLFQERFATSTGRARFSVICHQAPAEIPSPDYPLYLTTGRVLTHYQSGAQTQHVAQLREMAQ